MDKRIGVRLRVFQRIVDAYQAFGDEDGFARVVGNDEIPGESQQSQHPALREGRKRKWQWQRRDRNSQPQAGHSKLAGKLDGIAGVDGRPLRGT